MTTRIARRTVVLVALAGLLIAASGARVASADDRVTPDDRAGAYVRLDGTRDAVHRACGGNRRQQQEPGVAVNPRDPRIIAVGAMDACIAVRNPLAGPQPQNWLGYYRSTDAGRTWQASLMPGYPGDPVQPIETGCVMQADPSLAFDNEGRLFYAGLCLVFAGDASPVDFRIEVVTFDQDGRRFVRQTRVDRPPTPAQDHTQATDRPKVVVDQSQSRFAGNVYLSWDECPGPGFPCSPGPGGHPLKVARSTDHARSFEPPVTVSPPGDGRYGASDLAVGPDGTVYVTFRTDVEDGRRGLFLAKSTDGGATFSKPREVARIAPFEHVGFQRGGGDLGGNCGDGPFACDPRYTYSSFKSLSAVAADETGVHLVWNARLPSGQTKVFVRSSPDGRTWPTPAAPIDTLPRGHQWWPDIASADGTIDVIFLDSRSDAAYAPDLPPGNTRAGTSSGPAVDTYLASSTDGGRTWSERRLSDVTSRPNFETYLDARAPWRGDYIYLSAVPGGAYAVWTDTRDIVPGTDTRPDSRPNGFDVFAPCKWVPNTVDGPITGYLSPSPDDPCLSQGGLDQNIYGAQIPRATDRACVPTAGLKSAWVRPRRHGGATLAFRRRLARPVDVDVFQTSSRRQVIGERLVARFTTRSRSISWNGRANRRGRQVGDGYLFVRYSMRLPDGRLDVRRVVLRRDGGRLTVRPMHHRPDDCGVVRSAKLERPVFGGLDNRALGIAVRLNRAARVQVTILRGTRVVRRYAAGSLPARRTLRLRFDSEGRPSGDYRVRIDAGGERVDLTARRL